MNRLSYAMGQNDALDNGNWLITWGRGARAPNPGDPPAPDVSATQVNPATGVEELTVVARIDGDVQTQGRMYPVAPVALAAEPIALTAEFPASTYTSIFHLGATDEPQVVVSFSRPDRRLRRDLTPSLSVTGADGRRASSAHVVAGEPAHAYLVTLTPDGDGAITFGLLAVSGVCRRWYLHCRRHAVDRSARRAADHPDLCRRSVDRAGAEPGDRGRGRDVHAHPQRTVDGRTHGQRQRGRDGLDAQWRAAGLGHLRGGRRHDER